LLGCIVAGFKDTGNAKLRRRISKTKRSVMHARRIGKVQISIG